MALWNITNIIKFEYYVESDDASSAIREAMDGDADETSESWHASEIDIDDDQDDDDQDDDDCEEDDDGIDDDAMHQPVN